MPQHTLRSQPCSKRKENIREFDDPDLFAPNGLHRMTVMIRIVLAKARATPRDELSNVKKIANGRKPRYVLP